MDSLSARIRSLSENDVAFDAIVAVGLTLLGWAQLALLPAFRGGGGRFGGPGGAPPFFGHFAAPTLLTYALVALMFLPLAFRRRYPLPVLAAATLFSAIYDVAPPHVPAITALAPLIALYTVGTLYSRKTLVRTTLATVAFTLAVDLPLAPSGRLVAEFVRITALFAFAAALGDATRNRRAYVAEVEQRAADAERSRDEEALRRVEEERLRIARELHDVTAHSLSIIAIQAGAAEKVLDRDPDAAKRALETIRLTSKSSLDELRAMLGVLRGADDDVPLTPADRLALLPELAQRIEDAGVRVELDVDDDLGELPAYAEVSAYRIVQEALTNVVRHAHATTVRVSVKRANGDVVVEVVDDGRGSQDANGKGGLGMSGMRERAAALGGTFEAGNVASGGFRVAARLPLLEGGQRR